MKKIIAIIIVICNIFCLTGCAKKCGNCEGTGTIKCSNCKEGIEKCEKCDGSGHYDCKKCSGEGYIKSKERCESCKDSKKAGYKYDTAEALKDLYYGTMKSADDDKYWNKCNSCGTLSI